MSFRRDLTTGRAERHTGSRLRRQHGKTARSAAGLLLFSSCLSVVSIAASAAPAGAATCDNYAPVKANVTGPWGTVGIVQLSYNPCNRRVWGYVTSYYPPCQSGGAYCAAVIVTQSNGNKLTCETAVGANSCNTPQASDANITSYADGYIIYGIQPQKTAHGRTASW